MYPSGMGVRIASLRANMPDSCKSRIAAYVACFLILTGVAISSSAPALAMAPESLPGATVVTADELIELAASLNDLVVIDARKPFDWENGHLDGAIHMVDAEMTEEGLAAVVRRDQAVAFYCNGPKCDRSGNAIIKAASWGWARIYWFRGGIEEWTEKNYPLTK